MADPEIAGDRLQAKAIGPIVLQPLSCGVEDFPSRRLRRTSPPLRAGAPSVGYFGHAGIKALFTKLSIRLGLSFDALEREI